MPAVQKVVATNWGALRAKYGREGLGRIEAALQALVESDAARGLTTAVVKLDSATAMKRYHGKAVTDAASPRQNKEAIDAIFQAARPDYLVIAGAPDVVPHQDLLNPVYAGSSEEDPDEFAYGDLPYACETPYSQHIEDFTGPTRAVGRLPDLTGAKDPELFLKLLKTAAGWKSRPRKDYERHLGISAAVWKKSTTLSLKALFGSAMLLHTSPDKGPRWGTLLSSRVHFINCHGAPGDPHYYGQRGEEYPIAHRAQLLTSVTEGTVVAAECCYGAELYAPALAGGQPGIASTYLAGGAYGVFGSSTVAYGPADSNGAADLLCQYFVKSVLAGASLGRAALQARQRFVSDASLKSLRDPINLKTLAQFSLMGDPSVHPVKAAAVAKTAATGRQGAKSFAAAPRDTMFESVAMLAPPSSLEGPVMMKGRELRRDMLFKTGQHLESNAVTVSTTQKTRPSDAIRGALEQELKQALKAMKVKEAPKVDFMTFATKAAPPPATEGMNMLGMGSKRRPGAPAPAGGNVHVAVARVGAASQKAGGVRQLAAVVALEQDGGLEIHRYYSK